MIAFRFLPLAEQEFEETALRYESEREGLGTEFLDELSSVLMRARRFPQMGTRITPSSAQQDVRRYLLRRFPYKLIGLVTAETLIVVAVPRNDQHPDYWRPRLAKVLR